MTYPLLHTPFCSTLTGSEFSEIICPEGPRIEKIQSREAILKKSSLQYGMKFSIENEIFILVPSLAAEKQGLGLKFSIENELFKPGMKISSENENFVRGGMVFSCVRARMSFFRSPGPLGGFFLETKAFGKAQILAGNDRKPQEPTESHRLALVRLGPKA